MATIYSGLTSAYGKAIYIDGTRTFSTILPDYIEPVKQKAAATYTDDQIKTSLEMGYINQSEYDETIAYKNSISTE